MTAPIGETDIERKKARPLAQARHGLGEALAAVGREAWGMRGETVQAIRLMLVLVVLCGVAYPLILYAIGQTAFPFQANGSLAVNANGQVIGSKLLAQHFTRPAYFHGRPSAVGYNAAGSGGSNLGPTNPQLVTNAQRYADQFRKENGLSADTPLPADIATASGSGLDPDISVAAAMLQVNRVAAARAALGGPNAQVTPDALKALVARHTQGRDLGVLGEPRINVLELNLAMDAAFGPPQVIPTQPIPTPQR
jgi:K+-transporting ATPase ATPase C chain